ncbi:hypothetical protein MUY39_29470, partial [Blautia sp. NSJ-165]|nr:hypothetical protein [Blautia sp. NSJ-165]
FFARVYIPNALMGVYVEGEAEDISKEERDRTDNPFDIPTELWKKRRKCLNEAYSRELLQC